MSEIIKKAKETLPNFNEVMSRINSRKEEFGEGFDNYLKSCLRRELKKLTMNPPSEENIALIGADIKDWGKIMRKKYNSTIYPDTDPRAGQEIPESDISYTYYFHNGKDVLSLNAKEDYTEHIGKIVKLKYQVNKRQIFNLNPLREIKEEELNKLQGIPLTTIKEINEDVNKISIVTDFRDNPLVRIKDVSILELRGTDNLMIASADDESVQTDNLVTITLFCDRKLLNFTEDAMGLDVFGFPSKSQEGQLNLNVIGVIIKDDRFKLKEKPEPIVEDESEDEVNMFL